MDNMHSSEEWRELVLSQLCDVFDAEKPDVAISPIADPLAWQDMIDNAPASINLYGAARFWLTVSKLLGKRAFTDGSPDMNCVVIELTPAVGLQLTADYNKYIAGPNEGEPVLDENWSVWMDYRFVALGGDDD